MARGDVKDICRAPAGALQISEWALKVIHVSKEILICLQAQQQLAPRRVDLYKYPSVHVQLRAVTRT